MGYWVNNFQEFERKKGRENRLLLNFYYVPSKGEKVRRVKVLVNKKLKIPTKFLFGEKSDEVLSKIIENPELRDLPIKTTGIGDFHILEIEIPYKTELIKQLPREFQTGNYDKMLRLSGFFPERKVAFSEELETKLQNSDEVELDLNEISYDGFLTAEDLGKIPWLFLDIEKPLWKNEKEKMYLKARKKLLRLDKKFENKDNKHELRQKAIKVLEDRLTIEIEGIGKIGLWNKECDASVSFITTLWKNCPEGKIREVYILDPKDEFEKEKVNNYDVYKFKTEKELISFFLERIRERKPLMSSGHNQVYDITQIRFAADQNKLAFEPAVKTIRPRRDFVREFFQRMKEDLIYLDTLWLNASFFPWLRQRTFSNLKLETVSRFHGIDFTKSLTHEQLREVELQRLAGKTKEIRIKAGNRIAEYSAGDVEPVVQMMENSPFLPLITKIKRALPFSTLTEIAFHPNSVNKYHDKKHFDRARNHRYHGYAQKERENEIQIFKKRFSSLKGDMLEWAGVSAGAEKDSSPVYEIYLPFEEWIKQATFRYAPEFEEVYHGLEKNEKIPFLQYLKALQRDMLVDYYFARRDSKIFRNRFQNVETSKFDELERIVDKKLLDSYSGSFRFLKNHFRSVYVALKREGRALIRPTNKNLAGIEEIPEMMEDESDLFLLRHRADKIRNMLTPGQKRVLTSFLTNFNSFEAAETEIVTKMGTITENPRELLYSYNQSQKTEEKGRKFYAKYRISVPQLTSLIARSYRNLASELAKFNPRIIDIKGDYMFLQANEEIKQSKLVYIVRELDRNGKI
jgi:hypothetical protein